MTAPGLSVNTERRELGTKEGGREVTADSADRDGTWVSIEPHEPTCLCGHAHRWSDHRGVQSKRTACLWEHTHTHTAGTHIRAPQCTFPDELRTVRTNMRYACVGAGEAHVGARGQRRYITVVGVCLYPEPHTRRACMCGAEKQTS